MNQDIQTRLERLETSNRRLKYLGGGLLGALGLSTLLAFSAPPVEGPTVCKEIWGERIVLRDSRGRDRLTFDAYSSKLPTLTIKDDKGKSMASVSFPEDGGMQFNTFKNGRPTPATFSVGQNGAVQLTPRQTKTSTRSSREGQASID